MNKPLVLCVMDGVGINKDTENNAVAMADMPFFKGLLKKYPHSELQASGESVGLPANTMGNSEVGHITIGAGRIVNQFLRRFELEDLDKNSRLQAFINKVKQSGGIVHIAGLGSDGRVHSDINHIIKVVKYILDAGLHVCLHFIADGRDTPPKSAEKYISLVQDKLAPYFADNRLFWGTLSGRYWAMDRNNNMDRTMLAADAIINAKSKDKSDSILGALNDAYNRGETDEFVRPVLIRGTQPITSRDGVIFANYRSDRARQIMREIIKTNATVLCFSQYGEGLNDACPALIDDVVIENTLGDVLDKNNLSQLRIAETEKYNHVTYFMDAERNIDYQHGKKILVPSPDVATFDLKPEMAAAEITNVLLDNLNKFDVIILNFANGDMVGHTGNLRAAIKAMECLDVQLSRFVPAVLKMGGVVLITADHGNAEQMWDKENKAVLTSHTTSAVNFIVVSNNNYNVAGGGLSDVAPTILDLLGIAQPADMTGHSLLQ